MRYDDGRRQFGRNVPETAEFQFGQNGNRNAITKKSRATRGIQPGNMFTHQLRVMSPVPETRGIITAKFDRDEDHGGTSTYYYHGDDGWSDDPTDRKPVLPKGARDTIVVAEMGFDNLHNGGVTGSAASVSMRGRIDLLNHGGDTIRSFELGGSCSCNSALTSVSYSNSVAPSFGTNARVRQQIYAVKVSWVVLSSSGLRSSQPDAYAAVNLYPSTRHSADWRYDTTWITAHKVPGLTDNVLSIGNVDYQTGICWANPSNHSQPFPWHRVYGRNLMGSPVIYYNVLAQSSASSSGGTLGKRFSVVTVDGDGNDVDEMQMAELQPFEGVTIGFRGVRSTEPQTARACGFYLKMTKDFAGPSVAPTETNVFNLLTPMRVFWEVVDVPPPPT